MTLFLVFSTHYVYNTIQILSNQNSDLIVNIDDFDTEEENTETEDEVEELDEYLFDESSKIFSNHITYKKALAFDKRLLSPHNEVASPPPLI